MSTLIVATHNRHKTQEIAAMIGAHFDEITDLASLAQLHGSDAAPEPEETATTFEGNARLKAEAAAIAPVIAGLGDAGEDLWILADDSGIEVDALDGRPGVHSARFAGENASDADNRRLLLEQLAEAGSLAPEQRRARFRCVLALVRSGELLGIFSGAVEGTMVTEDRGSGGFGYDPVFQPDGHDRTFGEMSADAKNQLSHRSRALEKLGAWLEERG